MAQNVVPQLVGRGYKMLKHEQEATQQRSQESFMARTQKFFHQGSLIADDALRQCRLTNYQTTELETRQAKRTGLSSSFSDC